MRLFAFIFAPMGIKYFQNVNAHIKQLFAGTAIVENSSLLIPSPFKNLFLPQENIAFHVVSLNAPFLSTLHSTFFYEWATHAEKQGLQPIHIWEDRWLAQEPIILSQLSSLAKKTKTVFARNTIVNRITQPQANEFLNEHHFGSSPLARYKYGLFHKKTSELLGVATYSAPRKFMRDGVAYRSHELIRYGSKLNTTITGGVSKLLKAFIDDAKPDDIMTYTDRDWWTGKSYLPLGFKKIELMPPIEFWVKPTENKRFTKNQISALLKDELNLDNEIHPQLSERGYIKVYNSGSRKFLRTLK